MVGWNCDTKSLNEANFGKLYIQLPVTLELDSSDVDYCLQKLGIEEVTEDNFKSVYQQVKQMLIEEFPPAPARGW